MKHLLLCLFLLPLFISCKKEDEQPKVDDQPKLSAREEILIKYTWVTTESKGSDKTTPEFKSDITCLEDDHINYHRDGTYKVTMGPVCNSTNTPFMMGKWRIEGNKFMMQLEGATKETVFEILTLNATMFQFRYEEPHWVETTTYSPI